MLIVAVGLLILLGVGGLVLSVIRAQRQNTLDRTLIAAILRNDTKTALHALDAGADANARVQPDLPLSVWRLVWNQLRGSPPQNKSDMALVALLDGWIPHRPSACSRVEGVPNENIILVKALLLHGAQPNAYGSNKYTPLMMAATWGYRDTVCLLLAHGANPNQKPPAYRGALICGIVYDDVRMTKALLDAGADPNYRDRAGDTALRVASGGVTADVHTRAMLPIAAMREELPDAEGVVRLLLAHHADVRPRGWRGLTALATAKERHNTTIVKMLIAAGATK